MVTNKTLTLDDMLGPGEAADFRLQIIGWVRNFVSQFFWMYHLNTPSPIPQTKVVEQPKPVILDYILALRIGFNSDIFTESDIAYFLDIPEELVRKNFKGMGIRPKIKKLSSMGEGKSLTCKLSSQIYEAYYKKGKDRFEIARSLGIDVTAVSEAILTRHIIEPRIVKELRVLYGIPDLDKPYKI